MALNMQSRHLYKRALLSLGRSYCDNKSPYQRLEDEAKNKPVRKVYGEDYPDWRTHWSERQGEWKSKLNVFVEKNPSPDVLNYMQRLPDLTMKQVKEWWASMKDYNEIENQKYMLQRVDALGANLAAVHFFTFRNAAVRLKDSEHWLAGHPEMLKLPVKYEDGWFIEAIDCTNFCGKGLRYEGLLNLQDCTFLKWLCLKNNKFIDVWCLDRLAGLHGSTLEYLDISGCKFTTGCITALAKMTALRKLIITDPGDDLEMHALLSLLEEEKPHLLIKAIENGKSLIEN